MATRQQHHNGAPVSIAHQFQHFRLLELPPEIVDLVENSKSPLSIKSLPPSSSDGPNSQPAYAALCTPTKAFQLRQVQTSNSLYVTQPALETHNDASAFTTRAFASCTTTLELHPQTEDAAIHMNRLVPTYDIVDGDVDTRENHISKARLFADIPLSDGQCEEAWGALAAFELSGSSYQPTANTLTQVWKAINSAAVAEGIKIDASFLTNDLASLVAEEGHPAPLAAALIRHLSTAGSDSEWSSLDRDKVLSFVATKLLEAKKDGSDYLTADFLDAWKDNLPELWRKDAELNAIQGKYELPSSKTIRAKSNTGAVTSAQPDPAKGSASRKWHEKFAKTRKK
ncbi:unnamed protein product [Periconia digitata]|uniref:Sister chromatid cohesion protein Dcc1 n=1 Tax=Periconia digitata TaxID=1303443 RepID=A0A9W4U5V1_9PLEO|nr:unnamed protein product [Periconia digitata]